MCTLWNEGYVFSFSLHGRSMVKVFGQQIWNCYHKNLKSFKKTSKNSKICYDSI